MPRLARLAALTGRGGAPGERGTGRRIAEVAAAAATLGVVGIAAYWLRERSVAEAEYKIVRREGSFSLRRYEPMVVASTNAQGVLPDALDGGFRRLFAYISGKRRAKNADTAALAMTTPVTAAPGDHPGEWKVRFAMPADQSRSTLPKPAKGVTIEEVPGRLIAAVRFPGRYHDRAMLNEHLEQLRAWVRSRGWDAVGEPEFAGYNSPFVPGAMRRNEWWLEVGELENA